MQYLPVWIAAIVTGLLLFHEYFWVNIIIMLMLHIVNHKRCGEFAKYAMTTFLPVAVAQIISAALGDRLSHAYSTWIVPVLERSGVPIPENLGEQVPFAAAVLIFLVLEAFSMWWVNTPIRRNHSSFMRDIIRANSFKTFSNQLSNMLRSLNEETQWDANDFIPLNAEVDILCDNKSRPKTKDLLRALQQSPGKNNITLVIGEPGSGKSVAMRGLCAGLLKKCRTTQRIPLYVNLKHWNKNWEGRLYPTPNDLKNFILDSFEQYSTSQFLRNNFDRIEENGGWFFILDSYDEIPFLADKNRAYNSQVSSVIYDFLSGSGGVLSSRPFRSPDADPMRVGNHFRILPFNEGQLIQFFRRDVGLSKGKCRALFADRPDIVDLARTPLLASLVRQYYQKKQSWPANQKMLYNDLMMLRIRTVLKESGEQRSTTPELMMRMTATLAYRMMETESSHSFLTLEEARAALPYPSRQVDTVVELLEAARICKLNGANRNMITFVHRRFMEFFVTQSSQFSQQTVQAHLSDIWMMGSYYDVLALYGEVCEPDSADALARVCYQVIMDPENDFQDIRNESCLYAINSLNFLFNAFRKRLGPVTPYIVPISEKILNALEADCHDYACLAVFATVVPLLARRCQEDILVTLLDFRYKWISQYLSRIFYRGGKNSETLLLAYIENLNSYRDLTFLRKLPEFLFMFAKEKPLRQYCFLRVVDIILTAAAATALGGYIVWTLFSGRLVFTLREPMTWVVWFRSLPLSTQLYDAVSSAAALIYVCALWLTNTVSALHIILAVFLMISILATADLTPLVAVALLLLVFPLVLYRLSGIVALKLEFRKAKNKLAAIGGFLLRIMAFVLFLILIFVGIKWIYKKPYFLLGYGILWLLVCIFVYMNPFRLIIDAFRLRAALKELKKHGKTLPRSRLERMLEDIQTKQFRMNLIRRLSRTDIYLTGKWTRSSRPVIGSEREDWLLTELDTKDLPLAH